MLSSHYALVLSPLCYPPLQYLCASLAVLYDKDSLGLLRCPQSSLKLNSNSVLDFSSMLDSSSVLQSWCRLVVPPCFPLVVPPCSSLVASFVVPPCGVPL